jgi:large subunit ribosomal protein L6
MSRIGKLPISIPQGVTVNIDDDQMEITGPKGSLYLQKHPKISYIQDDSILRLERVDMSRTAREQYGLQRTLLNNAVVGVSQGYEKGLELIGVGYKVNVQDNNVVLNVGYSHPHEYSLPKGIQARAEGNKLFISGIDKQQVGEVAAQIRRIRPPEPYKGKGIKYISEEIRRKAGKSGKK